MSEAREAGIRAETAFASLQDRLTRAEDALAKFGDSTEEGLAAEAARAADALEADEKIHSEKASHAPTLPPPRRRCAGPSRSMRARATRLPA